jgi:hypothetical protein
MADSKARVVSDFLKANWILTSPVAADIAWLIGKSEAALVEQVTQNYVIACYSPPKPETVDAKGPQVLDIAEDIAVDVMIKSSDGDAVREDIIKSVRQLIFANKFNFQGCAEVLPVGQAFKSETPSLFRALITVRCRLLEYY